MCFVPWDLLVAGGNHRSPKVGKPGGRNPTAGPVVGVSIGLGNATNLFCGVAARRSTLQGPAGPGIHLEFTHLGSYLRYRIAFVGNGKRGRTWRGEKEGRKEKENEKGWKLLI